MKQTQVLIAIFLLGQTAATADTLQLKNGAKIEGTFLSGNTHTIQFIGNDGKSKSYSLADVDQLTFVALPPPPPPTAPPARAPVQLPAGTEITVRLIDNIDVDSTAAGQKFRASIDDPIMIGGNVIVPRGASAELQAAAVKQSGRFKGSDEITLKLNRIAIKGKYYEVVSSLNDAKSQGEGKKTGRKVLGGAGLGAIIGGIAGGGTGAAIGAAAGGAGGTALAATGQAHLKLPPETRLQFQLTSAVNIK